MAYEIYRTNATVSGRSGSVRANYDVRTGGQAVGAAIAGAGSVLQQLGEKWDLQEADTQFTKAKALARQEHNNFLIASKELEPEYFQKTYATSMKLRQSFTPKNRRAAGVYNNWLTSIEPYFAEDKNNRMMAKIEDNGRMGVFNSLEEFVSTGQGDGFVNLAKGVSHGWYSKEEAAKIKQGTLDDRDRFIKATEVQRTAAIKEAREKYEDDTLQVWGYDYFKNKLTLNTIWNSSMSDEKKRIWDDRVKKQQEGIIEGKEQKTDVIRKSNARQLALNTGSGASTPGDVDEVLAEMRADFALDDASYEEIRELMQRTFLAGQIQTIQGRITANKTGLVNLPSEYDLNERIRMLLSTLPADKSGMAIEKERSLRQLQMKNWDRYSKELTDYHKEHPEAGIDELYNYGEMLLTQYKKTPDELRFSLGAATEKHGQEELKKAKQALEGADKYKNQVDILKLQFNLNSEEVKDVQALIDKGETLGDITEYLRGLNNE